jgi:diguanylate cyclase (GGDEF)-like protein
VATSISTTIREADTACRLMDGGYALVLEDTSENGAIWTVERIRRHMATNDPGLTMWAGVACYPAHGFTTDEVLDRADLALDMAREWRQDRIEVASSD